jgi:aldehyde:ferredoxin oxidoreductase
MAFEAYNTGLITLEDTEGLDLSWGNYDAATELLQQMIEHRGFGGELAPGLKAAAAAVGGNADQFLVHVKGAGINIHDWRPLWGSLWGQIIAGTGPTHQAGSHDFWKVPRGTAAGLVDLWQPAQLKKIWEDCTGVCMFACQGVKDVATLAPRAVAEATGWENFSTEEAMLVGERTVNLMRLISVSRGFTKSDDLDVSPRLLEAPPAGPGKGEAFGPHLAAMIDEYYELMGWEVETGQPTQETIDRLDLNDMVSELSLSSTIGT